MSSFKPPDQRQRRNRPVDGRGVPAQVSAVVLKLPEDRDWHPRTVAWVDAVNRDTVSQIWTPTEIESALDLAELKDAQYRREAPASATNHIRQREDSLGLTALGRSRLGIKTLRQPQATGQMPVIHRRPLAAHNRDVHTARDPRLQLGQQGWPS